MKQYFLELALRHDSDQPQILAAVEALKAQGLLAETTLTTSEPDTEIGWLVGPRRILSMATAQRGDLRAATLDVVHILRDPALASLSVHFIDFAEE